MIKYFPRLYKLNSSGKLLEWNIQVEQHDNPTIVTTHGQVGGKIQTTHDVIKEGKNIGKKNETTAWEQACSEAESKWKKQFDKGYLDDRRRAEKGESNVAVAPMLAHDYDKHGKKMKFPAMMQPKLDGIRCLAVVNPDTETVRLYTRTGKPITSMVHIEQHIIDFFVKSGFLTEAVTLDGELYNHELKHEFEKIVSHVRKEHPAEGCEIVQYHIYDVIGTHDIQLERIGKLRSLFRAREHNHLKLVHTGWVRQNELESQFREFVENQGYEGLILRNSEAHYEYRRSYSLQRYKVFDDAEFDIVGVEEGRGKLAGHAAAFICRDTNGTEFKAKLDGEQEFLKKCFERPDIWKGKRLTVRYQGLTAKSKVPRFPVGKAIRDYE